MRDPSRTLPVVLAALAVAVLTVVATSSLRGSGVLGVADAASHGGIRVEEITARSSSDGPLAPGAEVDQCFVVTATEEPIGPGWISMFIGPGNLSGSGLEDFVELTVELAPVGTDDPCGVRGAVAFSGTLGEFADLHHHPGSGIGAWTPAGAGDARTYHVHMEITSDNRAQHLDVAVTFTWGFAGL